MVSAGCALGHPRLHLLPRIGECVPAAREEPQASLNSQGLELSLLFFSVYLLKIKITLVQQTARLCPLVFLSPQLLHPQTSPVLSPQSGQQGQIPAWCKLAELSNRFLRGSSHHTIFIPVHSRPCGGALCCWVMRAKSLSSPPVQRPKHRHAHTHTTPSDIYTHVCTHQAHMPAPAGSRAHTHTHGYTDPRSKSCPAVPEERREIPQPVLSTAQRLSRCTEFPICSPLQLHLNPFGLS